MNPSSRAPVALSLAYVASGRIESYVASGQYSWDMAAGIILVEEAGGKITDFEGQPYKMSTREWLITNNLIHNQMVELLKL